MEKTLDAPAFGSTQQLIFDVFEFKAPIYQGRAPVDRSLDPRMDLLLCMSSVENLMVWK
jgi:hypothetical protein